MSSLLKQLAQHQPSIPETLRSLYGNHKKKKTQPSFDEIIAALQPVAQMNSRNFVIIDALDELPQTGGCVSKFLLQIFSLQAKCGLNIFATSRIIPEIVTEFDGSMRLDIRARDNDLQSYLDAHILALPSFVRRSMDMQDEIKSEIIKAADGM
jgi:hypothetical protein